MVSVGVLYQSMERRIVLRILITAVLVTAVAIAINFASCTSTQDIRTAGGDVEDTLSPAMSGPHAPDPQMTSTRLVHGMIIFKSTRPELTGATVHVRLEDVSRADASANIVSEQLIENPAEHVSPEGIPFVLSGNQSDIDLQRRYSVSVHVDMNRSGEVNSGDYISMKSYPVLTDGNSNEVIVSVQRID